MTAILEDAPSVDDWIETMIAFTFSTRKFQHLLRAALVTGSIFFAGCASGVTNVSQTSTPGAFANAKPATIYVYAFDSASADVKIDHGGLAKKLASSLSGETDANRTAQAAADTGEAVANEIVSKLQSSGLPAMRASGPVPAGQNALIVQGHFATIDEGNRRRRILIGLGAGKSEVGASVQLVYQPAGGAPVALQSFAANADSGKAPGVAETAGVGAAAGHVATAAMMGGGLHAASEGKHDGLSADAKKLADSIAKQIAQASAAQGWGTVEWTE